MECIKYINDLNIEISMLEDVKKGGLCDIDEIDKIKNILEKCKTNLSQLSDNQICYRLYLKMLNGFTPTKAVEKVAEENYLNDVSPSAVSKIWDYYRKLKKILNRE